MNVVNAVVLC